jgi:hygromycin-B 4-O-kinase
MTTDLKPILSIEQILALLEAYFNEPVEQLAPVNQGLIARTFTFLAQGKAYIMRFQKDNMQAHFLKEAFIARHFVHPQLPLPEIIKIGRLDDLHYAISIKAPGVTLDRLSPQEYQRTLPSVIETMWAIHQADVSRQPGWGLFNDQGEGLFPSWRSYLESVREEEEEWDFYGKWHPLFDTTFLEREVFGNVYTHMYRLIDFCPPERWLVHGGYGYGNTLAQDGKVTAVIDWMDAKYGDFVYDIAWLDFWQPSPVVLEQIEVYYSAHGLPIPHFRERLACCKCYMALDTMRFFAKTNDQQAYRWLKGLVNQVIAGI